MDRHTHCPCNGVWLCGSCHQAVHAHPGAARKAGFILSQWVTDPAEYPVRTPWGTRTHICSGIFTLFTQVKEQP